MIFLTAIADKNCPLLLISGNHDSPERLNFGSRIMAARNIHLAGVFSGAMDQLTLTDQYGEVNFYLLPFVRPAQIRRFFPEATIESYQDAIDTIISSQPINQEQRNVLVAHQFITAGNTRPLRSDSERINVGTLDNIDAASFGSFDYVALGHIHRAQSIGGEHIRYAGSPLKYSISEATHQKSLTMVELMAKGSVDTTLIPLKPLRDLRQIKGPLAKLISQEIVASANPDDYLHVTLTDEEDLASPMADLRRFYPNILKLDIDNSRSAISEGEGAASDPQEKSPLELFDEFYQFQQNIPLADDKRDIVKDAFAELGGEL